jgi:SAM-dependent methyltransferase
MNLSETTFSGIYADSYDKLYGSLDPRNELTQAEMFCEVTPSDSTTVIDVGGGTGRFSELLCQANKYVYLVEPSTAMTAIARKKLSNYENLTIIDDNAQGFKIPTKADGAYLMFSVASYFSSPAIFRSAIENIISNLATGGYLYLDVWESNESTFDGLKSTIKRFSQSGVEYERTATINRDSIVESEPGFHTLSMSITFQNLEEGGIYQENHELALVSKKWVLDFCAQNQRIKQVRIRSNPKKENNLEVYILVN